MRKLLLSLAVVASLFVPSISFAARGFGPTLGTATTDLLIVGHNSDTDNLTSFTISAWVYRNGIGGAGAGRILHKADGSNVNGNFIFNFAEGLGGYAFKATRWADPGNWYFANATTGAWRHILVTYSYDDPVNTPPAMYLNGVAQVVVEDDPAGGVAGTDAVIDLIIGNSVNGLRNFDGCLAYVGIWNRVLDAGEIASVYAGIPTDVSSGLVASYDLTGMDNPEFDTSGKAHLAFVSGALSCAGPIATTTTTTVTTTTTTVTTTTVTTTTTTTTTIVLPSTFVKRLCLRFTAGFKPCTQASSTYLIPGDIFPVGRLNSSDNFFFGWDGAFRPTDGDDREPDASADNRISGFIYKLNNGTPAKLVLSGLPYPATYNIRCALGDPVDPHGHQYLRVEDTVGSVTPYLTLDHSSDGTPAGSFRDCSDNLWTTSQWPTNNVAKQVSIQSSSITFVLAAPSNIGGASTLSYVEVELVGTAPTTTTSSTVTTTTASSTTTSLTVPSTCIDGTKTLFWNQVTTYANGAALPNNNPDGYMVYVGSVSGTYNKVTDLGGTTATPLAPAVSLASVMGGKPDGTYYFVVTAYIGSTSNQSTYSNELYIPNYRVTCNQPPVTTTTSTPTTTTTAPTTTTTTTVSTTTTTLATGPVLVNYSPPVVSQSGGWFSDTDSNVDTFIENTGDDTTTTGFHYGYYLSTNATFDAADTFLVSASITTMGAGAKTSKSFTIHLPSTTVAGVYYIIGCADYDNGVAEAIEGTGCTASAAFQVYSTVTPTTIPSSIPAPAYLPFRDDTRTPPGDRKYPADGEFDQVNAALLNSMQNREDRVGNYAISVANQYTDTQLAAILTQPYNTQIVSLVQTGTAPASVNSTTKVTNWNADLLDGLDWGTWAAAPGAIGGTTPNTAKVTNLTITTGVSQGGGFKAQSVTTGAISGGASAAVTLTWTSAFADALYIPTCSLVEATATTSSIRIHHIQSFSASAIVVRIVNDDGAVAKTGTLYCVAIRLGS